MHSLAALVLYITSQGTHHPVVGPSNAARHTEGRSICRAERSQSPSRESYSRRSSTSPGDADDEIEADTGQPLPYVAPRIPSLPRLVLPPKPDPIDAVGDRSHGSGGSRSTADRKAQRELRQSHRND